MFDDGDDDDMIAATCNTESDIASAQPQSTNTKIPDDDSDDDADDDRFGRTQKRGQMDRIIADDDESRGK